MDGRLDRLSDLQLQLLLRAAGYSDEEIAAMNRDTMLDTLDSRWQRGTGSWHAEWQTIRELVATTASAVNRLHASLDGLRVPTDTMAQHATGDNTGHAAEITDLILEGDSQ